MLILPSRKVAALSQGVPVPVISIQSGGGYAGSVYASSVSGGQWYADGVAIVGATSQTWTMTLAYEGAAVTYRRAGKISNVIEMWTPDDLPSAVRVARWDIRNATTSGGAISAVGDSWGGFGLSQPTGSAQFASGTVAGQLGAYTSYNGGYPARKSLACSSALSGTASVVFCVKYDVDIATYAAGDQVLAHSDAPGNEWKRLRTLISTPSMSTEGVGTVNTMEGGAPGVPYQTQAIEWVSSLFSTELLRIGRAAAAGGYGWPGYILQAFAIKRALLSAERQQVAGYVAHLYSATARLAADHPYKSAAPRLQ